MLGVASGQADIAIQVRLIRDYAPLKVIVEEAGGTLTDFEGGDRLDTGKVVATNGRLHQAVLDCSAATYLASFEGTRSCLFV